MTCIVNIIRGIVIMWFGIMIGIIWVSTLIGSLIGALLVLVFAPNYLTLPFKLGIEKGMYLIKNCNNNY